MNIKQPTIVIYFWTVIILIRTIDLVQEKQIINLDFERLVIIMNLKIKIFDLKDFIIKHQQIMVNLAYDKVLQIVV